MKIKVSMPKTLVPNQIIITEWSIYLGQDVIWNAPSKPDQIDIDNAFHSAKIKLRKSGFNSLFIYVSEIQFLSNGDIWEFKRIQATLTKDES